MAKEKELGSCVVCFNKECSCDPNARNVEKLNQATTENHGGCVNVNQNQ